MQESPKRAAKAPNPVVTIFLTVFLDLLGFGIFIPDLQLRGETLASKSLGPNASPTQVGTLVGIMLASYSIAQLITSPLLGRLSDQIGRRKILLFTALLSTVAYLIYAFATNLGVVVLSRTLLGVAAANLGVAYAYIADVTPPEDRAKSLGILGAAFGLGFILGPSIGVLLLKVGNDSPLPLGIAGAAFTFINAVFIYRFVRESRPVGSAVQGKFFKDFGKAIRTPGLGLLLAMFFAINFGFTNLEATYFRLLKDPNWIFHLGEGAKIAGGFILIAVGFVGVFVQGYLIRILTPKFGEVRLLRFAYLLYLPAFALVPFVPLWIPAIIGIIALGAASGLSQPSINSLISRTAPPDLQGGIFGVTTGLGALARCVGPLVSSPLFSWRPYAPYLVGAAIISIPAMAAWWVREPQTEQAETAPAIP